jgi:hypothetical protein
MVAVRDDNPLHPVVQLKFGDGEDFVLTIPPEHLVEFTYISTHGSDTATITFIDSSFGDIERQVFLVERKAKPILFRWGYPGNGLEQQFWHKMEIKSIVPHISSAGIRLTIDGYAPGAEFATLVGTTMYRGKISSVAKQIALEMGYKNENIFIEETNDDHNEIRQTPIATGPRTRVDILNYLSRIAISKTNAARHYTWGITTENSFHFHTADYVGIDDRWLTTKDALKGARRIGAPVRGQQGRVKGYRVFEVLFGRPTGVIEFTPRYEAISVGNFAASVIGQTLDPRSKQYLYYPADRDVLGMTTNSDQKNAKTTAPPLVVTKDQRKKRVVTNAVVYEPTKQVGTRGRCAGQTTEPYTTPETARNKVASAWMKLQHTLLGGSLELVGLPEWANFVAREQFIDIFVVLPEDILALQGSPQPGLHWSSGRYHIDSVLHSITTGYVITAELDHATFGDGPFSAKTGPPQRPQVSVTKVSREKVPVHASDLDVEALIRKPIK